MSTTPESLVREEISDEEWMPAAGRGQKKGRGRGKGNTRGKGKGRKRQTIVHEVTEEESSSNGSPVSPQRPKRGRGGRGRGQVRGRGRGRGRQERNRAQEALETVQSRQDRMKAIVQDMTEEKTKEILIKAISFQPGLMFDIIEPMAPQPGGHHPTEGSETPNWCTCTRCREMPSEAERVCCGKSKDRCISILPDFQVLILDEAVLALARLYRNDVLVLNEEVDLMKANRHQGYRQFTLWQHGRLGAGTRRVIPSCCVWRIRDRYPDPFGQYKGFVAGRLA